MLHAHLYPHAALEPWESSSTTLDDRIQIGAALLLFDELTVSSWRYPGTFAELLRELEDVNAEIDGIRTRLGSDRVDRFCDTQDPSGLTFGDAAPIFYATYIHRLVEFYRSYRSLLNEGIIKFDALSDSIHDAADKQYVGLERLKQFMVAHTDELQAWQRQPENVDRILRLCGNWTNGMWALAYPIAQSWRGTAAEELLQIPLDESGFLYAHFGMGTMVTHAMCEAKSAATRLYLGDDAAATGQVLHQIVGTVKEVTTDHLAHRLLSKVIAAVPAVVPRSPDALLDLRYVLRDELAELRQAIYSTALDLGTENAQPERLDAIVSQRFVYPLRTLERRLAHPGRDILRNIVGGAPLAAAVTFAAAPLIGLPLTVSAVVGLAVDTLTAAAKTSIERNRRIEESPVAFLLRAQVPKDA